jgi:2'-5' RNA ligase
MRFLGNIRDSEVPELCQVVQQSVSMMEPVMVSVKGMGVFPNLSHPKVIWLGMGEGRSELQHLHRQVSTGLQKLGFPRESSEFRPHLTLGRIAGSGRLADEVVEWIERHHDTEFGGFEIDQVIVYSSFQDKEGPTYTPMATIDLNG